MPPVAERRGPPGDLPDRGRVAGRLRGVGDRLWSTAAGRGGLVFVLASVTVSLSNFVFHLVLSRLLGPAGYGALGALVNVTTVATVPLAAIQVTVAQSIAARPDPSDTPPLGRLLRIATVVAVVALALWLAATPTLDRFFHLSSPEATIWLGIWLVLSVVNSALEGVLLGQRRFRVVAAGQLLGSGAARLVGGVVLVEAGFGVTGGVVATVLASAVVLAVYAAALRRALLAGGRFVPRASDALLSTMAMGGAALLTSLDAWLGRHFLAARPAGLFVAAATAGNIALFLPGAITTVYFPRLAASGGRGPVARQVLGRATALVSLVALGAAGVIALFPGLVVGVLFGAAFAHARVAIGTVAVADAGIAVASCLVYFHVARRSRLALAPWLFCGLAVVLAAAFHGSIEVLAVDMVVACWAMVAALAVPTAVAALRTLAEDTSTLGRRAILLDEPVVDLSVVVPFYNVGVDRLVGHLAGICETLRTSGVTFEVVPVSDGSTDVSPAAVAALARRLPDLPAGTVRPIAFADNRGKGEALRAGMAHGRGRYLGFIDGDGDIPAASLAHFVDVARREQPEIVVGSKRHRDADVSYPPLRRLYSTGYQALTAALFGLRVRDTQTGIKLVRRDVLAEVLPRMVEKRFAFDLELLAVAHRIGYGQVAELPVAIGERFPSTISPRAVWRMLQDTLAVFWRLRALRFYDPPLVEAPAADAAAAVLAGVGVAGGVGSTGVATLGGPAAGMVTPDAFGELLVGSELAVVVETDRSGFGEPEPAADDADPVSLAERLAAGQRLRILVCNWRDLAHPHAGGAEVYTHRVAQAWVAAGHQVTWFCAAVAGRPSLEVVDGITVVRRGGRYGVYRQARRYWERQGRNRFDLVVDEVNTRPFEAARWVGDTPVVALIHQLAREVWFHELAWPVAALGRYFLEPRWLRRLRAVPVLTVSASSRASLVRAGLSDVTVVPEGIDPVVRPDVDRAAQPTVVFVGRLARNKRPDEAVEAFRLVRQRVPEAQMWMIGTGPMADDLRRHAPPGLVLLGRVPEGEKLRRLAQAHCLVATSAREGWGLTVTEAAQVGTPSVAYDVDGLRDSVAASGGVLVAPRPQALAEALVERLPVWADGGVPAVDAGGVLPWPAVAEQLLHNAATRVTLRRRATQVGEDVAVAWRRAMVPVAAACDRRAWAVAGIAALVALAPLSEAGMSAGKAWAAGAALVCMALATVGTLAEALTRPAGAGAQRAKDRDAVGFAVRDVPGGPGGRRGARARAWPAPLAVVGIASALVAQSWAGGAGFTSAAAPPWLGGGWVHQLVVGWTARGDRLTGPVSAASNVVWAVLAGLVHGLGGGTGLAERLWLTVLFAAVGVAGAGLLWVLELGAAACVVGGVAYGFSPYVLAMSGLNPSYLATMVLVPALVAWVLVVSGRHRLGWRWTAMVPAGLLLGTAAASPPMAVSVAVAGVGAVALAGWLGGRPRLVLALRRGTAGAAVLVASAACWLVPYAKMLATTSMVTRASELHWGWAEPRATLANGLWLNDAWSWPLHQLFPYADGFHRFPLVLWRYALPIMALVALGAAGVEGGRHVRQFRLRVLAAAAVVALLTTILSTGTHLPGAPLFGLLTALPFGWLLNDPGRFLFVAGLAYSVMLAVWVDQWLATRHEAVRPAVAAGSPPRTSWRSAWPAVIALCVVLAVPAYPLVAGRMRGAPGYTGVRASERTMAGRVKLASTWDPAGLLFACEHHVAATASGYYDRRGASSSSPSWIGEAWLVRKPPLPESVKDCLSDA